MNTLDAKDVVLFDILKIWDNCIRSLISTHIKKNGKIGYKINCKYCGTWIYFTIILIYIICPFLYKCCDSLIIFSIVIVNTIALISFSSYEENYPRKKAKKENYYDLFYSQVVNYSPEKQLLLNDYIEHLLLKNKRNNNEKVIVLVFIPLMINIAANNIGQIGEQGFLLKLIVCLFVGVIFIIIYNMLPKTFNLEVLKLIRVKRFIEYALLCRRMEEINKSEAQKVPDTQNL